MTIHTTTTHPGHPGPRFRCATCGYEVLASGGSLIVVEAGDPLARHYNRAEVEPPVPEVWVEGLADVDLRPD